MKTSSLFIYMRYHLFMQYGWFLQNLGKDYIRTNMHTTVPKYIPTYFFNFKNLKSIPRYCSTQCRHLISHANLILTFSDILILQASTIRTSIDTCQIIAIITGI